MARDLFRQDEYFVSLVNEGSRITGEDLRQLCLKGPEKKLLNARFLQPLLVAVSLGYLRHLQSKGIKADFFLGHSLGEITALAAAGVIDSFLAIKISAKRGELMNEAASLCNGAMMAVLSVDPHIVQELIQDLQLQEKVVIANDNAPDQIVVSGDRAAMGALAAKISAQGGKSKKLNVSGPWHSPYLKGAHEKFKVWAQNFTFQEPHTPIILNSSAQAEKNPQIIKNSITLSLCSPVYFKQCMQFCKDQSIDTFCEIGPGRVLAGLVRANGCMQGVRVYNVNNLKGVDLAAGEVCTDERCSSL
jgi:[acyl-carrier-protein] S-malonyltransferase